MKDYEKEYEKFVGSPPPRKYSTAEEEGRAIKKYTRLKDEDVRYEDVAYSPGRISHIATPTQNL